MSEKEQKTIDQSGQESAETQTAQQTEPVEHVEQTREPSQVQTGLMIADRLGETEELPRQQIIKIVQALGRTQACAILEQTLEIQANGGMLTQNKKQKRTVGGIFFHLAYTTGIPKEGKVLKRLLPRKPAKANQPAQPAVPAAPPPPPFAWEDRLAILEELQAEKGTTSAKIMLMGTLSKYYRSRSLRGRCAAIGEKPEHAQRIARPTGEQNHIYRLYRL